MRTPGVPAPRISRALAAVVAAGALLVGGAAPALAHDEVVATTPAAQATVPSPPAVELGLSSPPQVLGTEVRVTGPDGSLVSEGAPEVVDTTVRQPLADGLAAGAYTVEWRVTSGDGHAITGSTGFSVARGAAAPTSEPPSTTAAESPAEPSVESRAEPSAEVDTSEAAAAAPAGSSSSAPLLVGGALLVLVVVGLVAWRLRRRA